MKDFLALVLLLPMLASCLNGSEKHTSQIAFSKRHFDLPVDTTVTSIACWDDYLLLLQNNGKLIVLDTTYQRVYKLEKNLASLKCTFLIRYNDTLFAGTEDKAYYLKDDLFPVEYNVFRKLYGDVLLEDSAYLIYGCCAGEWGGSVFFRNKQSGKTYSYFATCPSQVLRFGKEYVVCNNLAHLSDHASFIVVRDPTTLYEITDENLKNHCNWYTTVDSLKEYWQVSKKGAVRFYDSYNAMSLVNFPYKDSLFSIMSVPKATVLAVHRSDTIITKDTLLHRKISFHEVQVIETSSRRICLYRLTEGSPFAAYWTRGNNTGLIIVKDNMIDFLEKQASQ